MKDTHQSITSLLTETRDIMGISAEYIMSFLDNLDNKHDQYLMYALSCNFHRVEYNLNLKLGQLGVDVVDFTYKPTVFKNVSYVDIDLVKEISAYLTDKKLRMLVNRYADRLTQSQVVDINQRKK